MKAEFVKDKKGKIYFRDKNGTLWDEKCIAEIFEMIHHYNKFLEFMNYYRSKRTDGKDYYEDKSIEK